MGIIKNLVNVLTGKQKNHIYHDSAGTWGFPTKKGINLKRIEEDAPFGVIFEALFKEGYDYVFSGNLKNDNAGVPPDTQANRRMVVWQQEKNLLVGYSKITAANGQPACCGYLGILKAEDSNDRILQLHYVGYSPSGKELFMMISKKCPASLAAKLPSVDYTDIVRALDDVYAIVTSVRIQ
jgi:hypothetical protein